MIRRSSIVAAIAFLLSLVVHLLLGVGFTLTPRPEPQPSGGETSTEIVAPGTAFEDLADSASEPEPVPEPPVAPEPVPDLTDVPTSQALIASDDPQQVTTPDTGTAQAVEPESTGPSPTQAGDTPEPTTVEPVGVDAGEVADPILTPPAGTDAVTDIPLGEPNAPAEPSEAPPQTTATSPSATVPATSAPVSPVAVVPVAPSVPVVSLQPSEIEAETPETTVEVEPEPPLAPVETVETVETVDDVDPDISETAITTSLRPRLPTKRPTPKPEGLSGGSSQTTTARRAPAPLIESPLTAFKRDGTNTIGRRSNGTRSGGQGARNSFSGGNSGVTNYAGRVLAQLNRTARVAVSGRGWARVLFLINPNGTLESVVVVDSSGSRAIDRAAQQQVRSAGRFPSPPDGKSRRLNFFYRIQ